MSMDASQHSPAPLILIFKDQLGQRGVVLDKIYYSVGRAANSHIRLYDPFVSRQHAVIIRVPEESQAGYSYVIFDGSPGSRQSTNGLFVNGKRVSSHRLQLFDKIGFGPRVTAIVRSTDHFSPDTLAILLKTPPNVPEPGSQQDTEKEALRENESFTAIPCLAVS
jgi:pSer/pThr/pTyr-binding forkhead associated (FHA) protein